MALGIEKLKSLLKAGLNFAKSATKALEDKKVSFFEAVGLLPEVFAVIGVAKTWPMCRPKSTTSMMMKSKR